MTDHDRSNPLRVIGKIEVLPEWVANEAARTLTFTQPAKVHELQATLPLDTGDHLVVTVIVPKAALPHVGWDMLGKLVQKSLGRGR